MAGGGSSRGRSAILDFCHSEEEIHSDDGFIVLAAEPAQSRRVESRAQRVEFSDKLIRFRFRQQGLVRSEGVSVCLSGMGSGRAVGIDPLCRPKRPTNDLIPTLSACLGALIETETYAVERKRVLGRAFYAQSVQHAGPLERFQMRIDRLRWLPEPARGIRHGPRFLVEEGSKDSAFGGTSEQSPLLRRSNLVDAWGVHDSNIAPYIAYARILGTFYTDRGGRGSSGQPGSAPFVAEMATREAYL